MITTVNIQADENQPLELDYNVLNARIADLARKEYEEMLEPKYPVSRINNVETEVAVAHTQDVYQTRAPEEFAATPMGFDASFDMEFGATTTNPALQDLMTMELNGLFPAQGIEQQLESPEVANNIEPTGGMLSAQEAVNNIVPTGGAIGKFTQQVLDERANEQLVAQADLPNMNKGGGVGIV